MKRFLTLIGGIALTAAFAALGFATESGTSGALRSAVSEGGRVEASATLTPNEPTLGGNAILELHVAHDPAYRVAPPDLGAEYGDFSVLGAENPASVIENGRETTRVRFRLAPRDSGESILPPIPIAARSTDGGEAIALLIPAGKVTVASAFEGQDVSLEQLSGARPPIPKPWGLYALIGAVLLAAVLLILWRIKHRQRLERAKIAAIRSPSEIALEALDRLIASKLHLRDVRGFYLALTGIVRRFIEQTTGVRAPEQTTEEFLAAMESNRASLFDDGTRRDLAGFLEFSDLVKFAKFQPTLEEIDDGCRKARKVVDR